MFYNPQMNPYLGTPYQPQIQQRQEVVKVNGENGARAYALGPNSSALLLDETGMIVWLVTAQAQGFNAMQAQLAQCCCDNRLGTEQLRATVLQENCADRYEAAQNTQNIIGALTAGIQSIKDELCADRLDTARRENDQLRTELIFARGQASQVDQTAQLRASQATVANQLVQELRSCPIPAQPVYGNTPIFTCAQNVAGGCGCNGGFNLG